jgi:hypothetical protein
MNKTRHILLVNQLATTTDNLGNKSVTLFNGYQKVEKNTDKKEC